MNILMINGTMRKSSTYNIGRMFIEKITASGDTVNEIFLPREMPEFCRGCGTCIMKDEKKCPDYLIYMKHITEMIDAADLLVFTTPVFVYHASGQMKALLDHYGYRWMVHRPEESMFRKQAVVISTAAGAGMKKAMKDITDSLKYWGVARIHTYGVAVRNITWEGVDKTIKEQVENELLKLAPKILHNPDEVTPAPGRKILFHIMRIMQKKKPFNEADREYWEEKGWLGKKRPWKKEIQ